MIVQVTVVHIIIISVDAEVLWKVPVFPKAGA